MNTRTLLTPLALAVCIQATIAQQVASSVERIDRVNALYEPCGKTAAASYTRHIQLVPDGYSMRVVNNHGVVRMTGSCSDAVGLVQHGAFRYYDDGGTLRSEGSYSNGIKTGTWHRYDDRGLALLDKEYDGLDWEAEQVKLGMSSMSALFLSIPRPDPIPSFLKM